VITVPERVISKPKSVITRPKRRAGFGLAMVLRMFSTMGISLFPFFGNLGNASTPREHAQIEGSPTTEMGVRSLTPPDWSSGGHQRWRNI
jgi:hypothetical protein